MSETIIGRGGPRDRASIHLATREGTDIPNERKLERPPSALRDVSENLQRDFPGLRVRSLSGTYNCVGMVFAARRTVVWSEHLDLILREDGYRQTDQPVGGDVIVYRASDGTANHVGVVVLVEPDLVSATRKIKVLSQFGFDGEYEHSEADVPTLICHGARVEYWTERRCP